MNKSTRPFYKSWLLWVALLIVCGWPWVNDWAWDSAKQEAQSQIAQFEVKFEAQTKAQPGGGAAGAASVAVDMSKLTCIAANALYSPSWQMGSSYHDKLIQAFIWHGYGAEIPGVQAVKERGCGRTEDGKYQFRGN